MSASQPVPQATEPEKSSRAGRNLPAAIGVGLLLGALIIITHFWHKELFLVLATASVSIGCWEIAQAMRRRGIRVPVFPVVLGCVVQLSAAFFLGEEALSVAFALTSALVLMWRGSENVVGAAADVGAGIFIAAYPALLAGFAMLLLAAPDGAWRSFTFLCVTVASDVGGYAVGVLAGRHPMAPRISPKKTWEGFVGSFIGCIIVGIVCVTLGLNGPWWVGAIVGLVTAPAATLGDLVESAIKRDLGIKDMSNILPGHGGLMDRLDSLMVSAPVIWATLTILLPIAR